MFYVASNYSRDSLENRGGTEKIVELLVKRFRFQHVDLTQKSSMKSGIFFFVGLPLISQIKFSLMLRSRAYIVKTATYSKNRLHLEKCIWWLMSFVSNVVVITRSQKQTYPRALHLDLLYLYGTCNLNRKIEVSKGSRPVFEYGYVGRIDRKKGYFLARDYL